MTLGRSARYALHAALELALAGDEPVSVARAAEACGIPQAALAKVFQQLVRAGLALGTRGAGGGYRLARRAAEISVLDVATAFEPPHAPGRCLLAPERPGGDCPRREGCGLRQLFDEADELVRCTFASVSLATLARRTARPLPAPPAQARGRGAQAQARPARAR